MPTAKPRPLRCLRRIACAATLALCVVGPAQADDATVIVHPAVPVTTLERKDLRAIFTLRRRNWPDGSPITIFVLPDNAAEHQRFTKEKLRLYPYQLRQRWDRAVFSGSGPAPTEVVDETAMRSAVAGTVGAIGYSKSASPPDGVKSVPSANPQP